MTRLPIPGADNGTWGDILNEFLSVEHNSDGSLKTSGTFSKVEKIISKGQPGGYASLDAAGKVPTAQLGSNIATSTTFLRGDQTWGAPPTAVDATPVTKGTVQLAGDLGGTATSPTVPGLASKVDKATTILAGTGLAGGGDLSANRTLTVSYGTTAGTAAQGNDARLAGAVQSSTVTAKGDLLAALVAAP